LRNRLSGGRNKYLKDEIALLDKQIAEINKLKAETQRYWRAEGGGGLQSTRSDVVHLLDQMLRILPDGVHLNRLNKLAIKLVWLDISIKCSHFNLDACDRGLAMLETPILLEIHAASLEKRRVSEFQWTLH